MWTKSFSKVYPGVKKADVWALWKDVNNWPSWHEDLEYCKIEGPFAVGNSFILKPKRMGPVKILLTAVEEGTSFTDCTTFWGAKMYHTAALEETAAGMRFVDKVEVTGPLTWLWVLLVARGVAADAPHEIATLAKLAAQRHG